MIDVFRWLLAAATLSLAFLPLTLWLFNSLPDRGIAFGKVLALVLVVWASWWIGFPTGQGGNIVVLVVVLVIGAGATWLALGRTVASALRALTWPALIEEGLFVVSFSVWALVRSLNPAISGTEKPMDMMLLQSAGHVAVSPPQDLWLAGHGVNYYYFGYLLMATMGKLAGTPSAVTYNLAIAFIFAVAISGTYSIVFALTRSRIWAALGPVLVVLSGNASALFDQVLHGEYPWTQFYWFWSSSRVVGSGSTINEFPMFSLVLGDLHPHVMAIPIALNCVAAAIAIVLSAAEPHGRLLVHPARIVFIAILTGSLFATNTWDFPTYLLLVAAALMVFAMRARSRSAPGMNGSARGTVFATAILIAASVAAFLPFYVEYHSPTSGIGVVTTVTNLGQFLAVFGVFAFFCLALASVAGRSGRSGCLDHVSRLLGISRTPDSRSTIGRETVAVALITLVTVLALVLTHRFVLLLLLVLLGVATWALIGAIRDRESATSRSNQSALLLIAVGTLVVALTEVIYVRDAFAGSALYRMNTVFKFYYQGWILLGLATAYGMWQVRNWLKSGGRVPDVADAGFATRPPEERRHPDPATHSRLPVISWNLVTICALLVGLIYTILGPLSYYGGGPDLVLESHGLDGMTFLRSADPDDYRALTWLNSHVQGTPTILEATGNSYTLFGRVSTFTGLPTLLGWGEHEGQWRGADPLIVQRHSLIDRIYSTAKIRTARRLIRDAGVSLVYVGPCEREVYAAGPDVCDPYVPPTPAVNSPSTALTKFRRFMRTVYSRNGVTIYEAPGAYVISGPK